MLQNCILYMSQNTCEIFFSIIAVCTMFFVDCILLIVYIHHLLFFTSVFAISYTNCRINPLYVLLYIKSGSITTAYIPTL